MCGIAGILRVSPPGERQAALLRRPEDAIPEAWLDVLDDSIRHRGPDGQGRFRDRAVRPDGSVVDVALVHRRLAIIDPACGHQPMVSARGRHGKAGEALVATVFNGCIYNHHHLRRELAASGHAFSTDHSDTEVLVHGWREWGSGLWGRIEGMCAAAVWDRAGCTLEVYRDQFGEKPLYHAPIVSGAGAFAFSSTAAALIRLRARADTTDGGGVDPFWVAEWAAFGYHPVRTPIRAISLLANGVAARLGTPGTGASAGERRTRETRAALVETRRDRSGLGSGAADSRVDRFERLIEAAVRRRLEADVPVACFLSGGVDSSVVAYHAARHLGRSLTTVCVRMPDGRYDESEHALRVAKAIGTEHVTVDAEPRPAEDLIALIETMGLPFGDSSLLPTHWAARAASSHAKVVLSGDGGDEVFLGYERYSAARWLGALDLLAVASPLGAALSPFAGLLQMAHPKSRRAKAGRFIEAARHGKYLDLLAIFPERSRRRLFPGRGGAVSSKPSVPSSQSAARAFDLEEHLPGDLLRKVDAASMAVPLEVRSPFLDRDLVAAALELSPRQLSLGGQRKGLLRAIARRRLPVESIDRPKMGFAIPIGEWLRADHGGMRTLLLDHLHSAEPWGPSSLGIEPNDGYVQALVDEHMSRKRDHGQRLYMLLVLSIWARWLGRISSETPRRGAGL